MRAPEKVRREVILGSRNRLMKRADQAAAQDEDDEQAGRVQLKHYRPTEYFAAHGGDDPSIGIEYWVVFGYRKNKEKLERRGYSNELFVNKQYPIIGTVNGQNHGELPAQLLREAGLPLLSRHMIVHIDASKAAPRVIRELFATNREGFKEGPVLSTLQAGLLEMLKEDEKLALLERELVDSITTEASQAASDEVKRQVVDLLMEAGFKPQEPGPSATPGEGPDHHFQPPRPGPVVPDPLPTLPFPEVTKWQIVYPVGGFELPISALKTVLVETDADSQFDSRNLISIRSEPPIVDKASQTKLKGGRIRWRIKTAANASIGSEFLVVCTITKPDGTQLISDVVGSIAIAPVKPGRPSKAPVPNFDIIGIHPKEDAETWNSVWPDIDADDSPDEKLEAVAYKTLKTGEKLNVYYSKAFSPLKSILSKMSYEASPLLQYFQKNYEVWIGYHAILQQTESVQSANMDDPNGQLEEERCRVATMQIKQALRTSDILHKLQLAQAQEAS